MNDVDFPVADVLHGIDGGAARRAWRRSRSTWSSSAAPTTTRSCRWRATSAAAAVRAALHRVHGRRRHQRLAHGRGAALGEVMRTHARAPSRSSRSSPTPAARPPSAGATATAAARSASSAASRRPSAATATARACRPKASSSCACSPAAGHDLRALLRGGHERRADRRGDRPDLGRARRPLLGAARRRHAPRPATAQRRVEMHYIGGWSLAAWARGRRSVGDGLGQRRRRDLARDRLRAQTACRSSARRRSSAACPRSCRPR